MSISSDLAYRRVYVWEFPVRAYHWINAICVLLLIVSGYLIGKPLSFSQSVSMEAYQQSWFGIVRFVHFVSSFVFVFNFIARTYWGFVGNRYARWNNFIPHRASQVKEIGEVLHVDILQTGSGGAISIGHNALAGLVYFATFLVFVFQSITGFALYSGMSTSFLPGLFEWVVPLMGGDAAVRQWHHIFMWFFVVFSMVHIYLVFYHDYVEGRGTTSSMVGGWKFERRDHVA